MIFVQQIFRKVQPRYLVRAYLISAALLAYAFWYFSTQAELVGYQKATMFGYALISAILFPFAKLVWDEVKRLIRGDTILTFTPLNEVGFMMYLMRIAGKIIVNIVLWFFAIVIAPLGILYLWLRTPTNT